MVISYKPEELNLDFPLCPQINIGCADPALSHELLGIYGNSVRFAHAHGTTRGYPYSNHICVRDEDFLNTDILIHEYAHLLAVTPDDPHGEFWEWVLSTVLKAPSILKLHKHIMNRDFPVYSVSQAINDYKMITKRFKETGEFA